MAIDFNKLGQLIALYEQEYFQVRLAKKPLRMIFKAERLQIRMQGWLEDIQMNLVKNAIFISKNITQV